MTCVRIRFSPSFRRFSPVFGRFGPFFFSRIHRDSIFAAIKNEEMKNVKVLIITAVMMCAMPAVLAQQVLNLEKCHELALASNSHLKIAQERVKETEALKGAALAQFFPKVSVNGTYNWNQKNISLLSDEQQGAINNMGTTVMSQVTPAMQPVVMQLMQSDPQLAMTLAQSLAGMNVEEALNGVGHEITDAFNIDTRNIFAGAVTVSEPIYLGGKIRAMYKTAKLTNQAALLQADQTQENLLIQVDEAYWRVISLQHKQSLAHQYCNLLDTLNQNVEAMVAEGVATQSDLTQVRVKLNEAQMSLTKAENGLALSKMVLYQLCGLNLTGDYEIAEEEGMRSFQPEQTLDMQNVWNKRKEIKLLEIGDQMAKTNVKTATSGLLPNVAVTGSYLVSNPNVFNGFRNKFAGMFTAGVVVNIPICHAEDFLAVKAAKHKRNEVQYELEEARNAIELQVNKLNYELEVANKKLVQAQSNLLNAEENLRLANESFEAGVINSSDLMAAQTAWMSAKSEVVDAEIEIRMDYLYLQQALGNN